MAPGMVPPQVMPGAQPSQSRPPAVYRNAVPSGYQMAPGQMMGQQPMNPLLLIRRQLPETLEVLYEQKLELMKRTIKYREEKNWGRRMPSWTAEYVWPGTPWDWTLEELKYVANDSWELRKWKKAVAYKLAHEAKAAAAKMMEDWRYRESANKMVALKTSVMVKQAFYQQFAETKRMKDDYLAGSVDQMMSTSGGAKRPRMTRRLQDFIRHVIATYSFQYETPDGTYKDLCKKLSVRPEEKKEVPVPVARPPPPVEPKPNPADSNIYLLASQHADMGPAPTSLYDQPFPDFFGNHLGEDMNQLLLKDQTTADNLLALPQPFPDDLATLSSAPDIPAKNYDEFLNDTFRVQWKPSNGPVKREVKAENPAPNPAPADPELEERKMVEDLEVVFLAENETAAPTEDSQQQTSKKPNPGKVASKEEDEGMVFFDMSKNLIHTLPKSEDTEFVEYMTHLPECTDPLYHKANQK